MKKLFLAMALASLSSGAFALTQSLTTGIKQVYATEEDRFGGCMVKTETLPSNNLNCKRAYISLDCAGALDGNTKSEGQRKLDIATLAMLTGGTVNMLVSDSSRFNGFCFAERIRLLNTGAAGS